MSESSLFQARKTAEIEIHSWYGSHIHAQSSTLPNFVTAHITDWIYMKCTCDMVSQFLRGGRYNSIVITYMEWLYSYPLPPLTVLSQHLHTSSMIDINAHEQYFKHNTLHFQKINFSSKNRIYATKKNSQEFCSYKCSNAHFEMISDINDRDRN